MSAKLTRLWTGIALRTTRLAPMAPRSSGCARVLCVNLSILIAFQAEASGQSLARDTTPLWAMLIGIVAGAITEVLRAGIWKSLIASCVVGIATLALLPGLRGEWSFPAALLVCLLPALLCQAGVHAVMKKHGGDEDRR